MRVERFSLFFPPTLFKHPPRRDRVRDRGDPRGWLREDRRDEPGRTEAGPGGRRARRGGPGRGHHRRDARPRGRPPPAPRPRRRTARGAPDPEFLRRAYYNQPVWKRVAVIAAGPAVNIMIAFLIFWSMLMVGDLRRRRHAGTAQPVDPHAGGGRQRGEGRERRAGRRRPARRATRSSPSTEVAPTSARSSAGSTSTPARVARRRAAVPPPRCICWCCGADTRLALSVYPRYNAAGQTDAGGLRVRRGGQTLRCRSRPPASRSARCGARPRA